MLLNTLTVQAIEEFLRDYRARFTGSEIARKKSLNQKTVSTILGSLENEDLLRSRAQGRNKLFSLNLENPLLIHFISAVEHFRTSEFYRRNPLIKEISGRIAGASDGIVIIFGSYAKGRQKKGSDLDVFIAGNYDEGSIKEISGTYRINVSIKHYSLPAFRKALQAGDPLIEEVIKDHIILAGIQQFVTYLRDLRYGKD